MIFRVSYSGRPDAGIYVEAPSAEAASAWLADFWGPFIAETYGTPPVAVEVDQPGRGFCVHKVR